MRCFLSHQPTTTSLHTQSDTRAFGPLLKMFLTYHVSEGLVFHVCVKLSLWFLHIRNGPVRRQNQRHLLALIKVSENWWQESKICTKDSADPRTDLLHTSFGGYPSCNLSQARYLPPGILPGGLCASLSADHETKAVWELKHNTALLIIFLPLI